MSCQSVFFFISSAFLLFLINECRTWSQSQFTNFPPPANSIIPSSSTLFANHYSSDLIWRPKFQMKLALLGGLAGALASFGAHQIIRNLNKGQFLFNDFLNNF
jgi:hypothetical protein